MRFTDRIAVDRAARTSRAFLFVDSGADFLTDHFPGAPTLPGLVMLEAAVSAAAALMNEPREDEAGDPVADRGAMLRHVERLQIVRRVVPGETLAVDVRMDGTEGSGSWFTARGTVGVDTAMRARFRLDSVSRSRR